MIAIYKINGYVLNLILGILPSADKTTADSFEKPAGIIQTESYQWSEGILEIDVDKPVILKPRVFIIKGPMILNSLTDYTSAKATLKSLIYQPYVTLEAEHLGEKANARIQPDGISWHRLTNLSNGKIAVNIELRFDELLQTIPFKEDGAYSFDVDSEMDLISTTNTNSFYSFSIDDRGNLIMNS